ILKRPLDANFGVIPANAGFAPVVIDTGAFVLDFRIVGKDTKSPRKSGGSPNLAPVFSRSFHADPLAKSWGSFANVHGYQEGTAQGDAHQLAHGRFPLEVQTTYNPFHRTRMVILYKVSGQTECFE